MPITDPHWPRADVWLASEPTDPEVLVVGVPSSSSSLSPSHADMAPLRMRDHLARYSTFHGELGVDFSGVKVGDVGNWPVSGLDQHAMPAAVEEMARRLPDAPLTVFLGGDNAITRPLVRARAEGLDRVGLITFDAHHDVRTLEPGPSNGNPVRGLIEEDGLPGRNVVQIGIHSYANSASYRAYCRDREIEIVTVAETERAGMEQVVGEALGRLSERVELIYVDVDVDVLDRVFAPGCPGARPGGLSVRRLAEGVLAAARHPKVTAIDLVEVDPETDRDGITVDAMAHLFLTVITGYAMRSAG